jgi:drug/metabolite transporter (DMT)-like permease
MIKALNALILVAGIIFVVLGAILGNLVVVIVGDVLVLVGVLLYLAVRRAGRRPSEPTG